MTIKQEQFIAEYLKDKNATRAYTTAYKCKNEDTARANGSKLLTNPDIKALISQKAGQQLAKMDISAEKVLREYDIIASGDLRDFYDEAGNLKPMKDWTAEMGKRVAAIETVIKNVAAGDGQTDTIHKIKLWPKDRALEGLAKHLGLLTERVELTASDELLARLDAWKGKNRT